jgi:hypothetical protein
MPSSYVAEALLRYQLIAPHANSTVLVPWKVPIYGTATLLTAISDDSALLDTAGIIRAPVHKKSSVSYNTAPA